MLYAYLRELRRPDRHTRNAMRVAQSHRVRCLPCQVIHPPGRPDRLPGEPQRTHGYASSVDGDNPVGLLVREVPCDVYGGAGVRCGTAETAVVCAEIGGMTTEATFTPDASYNFFCLT